MSFNFRPGWMISDCSSASGGIRYDREQTSTRAVNDGSGLRIGHLTTQTVDNVEFCAAVDACVKRVDYVLRKHCARTAMGWFADATALKLVNAEIEVIQQEAAALNSRAADEKSHRHAKVRIVPLWLDLSQSEAAREIITTVLDVLIELHTALRSGELTLLHKLRIRAKQIDQLFEGEASLRILRALERVPEAANEIRARARASAPGKKRSKRKPSMAKVQAAAETVDLSALEQAISLMSTDYELGG